MVILIFTLNHVQGSFCEKKLRKELPEGTRVKIVTHPDQMHGIRDFRYIQYGQWFLNDAFYWKNFGSYMRMLGALPYYDSAHKVSGYGIL